MVGYVTVGTNDFERATGFYDALFGSFGVGRFMSLDGFIVWMKPGNAGLALTGPYDGQPATVGNGGMVALAAESREQVDAIHARALELGAADEGAPGPRGEGFYAAYFRDLDGNKLAAFFMG